MKIHIKYDKNISKVLSERLCNQPTQKPIFKELNIPYFSSLYKQYVELKWIKS